MKIQLYNMHVLDALRKIPSESVDCVFTSPPYYGLRSYKGATVIWGGDKNCKHIMETTKPLRSRNENDIVNQNSKQATIHGSNYDTEDGAVCSLCGAWRGQLGLEPSYKLYLDHMLMVTAELKRILKKTGTLFWNMGDTYSAKPIGAFNGGGSEFEERDMEGIASSGQLDKTVSGISPKSLMLMPERLAICMVDEQQWVLRNKVIWKKLNALPSSVKDRLSNKWEYVYFFTKSRKYYFDLDAIRKPLAESTIREIREGYNGNSVKDYDSEKAQNASETKKRIIASYRSGNKERKIEEFRPTRLGSSIPRSAEASPKGANPGDVISDYAEWYFNEREKKSWHDHENDAEQGFGQQMRGHETENLPHPYGANPGDVYSLPTYPHAFAHFAVFPEKLVEPFLKAGCPKGGVVLDPFAGSGTVAVVARRMELSSISIEISREYCDILRKRIGWGMSIDDTKWVEG